MSAIKFQDAIDLIKEHELCCIKVLALDKSRICEYLEESSTTDAAINYLQQKKHIFAAYGRVKIIATTASGKSQNWTNAFNWIVQCDGNALVQTNQNENINQPKGFISQSEANLIAQFEALKMQIKHNEELRELKEKLKERDNSDPFLKYLPLAPMFIKDPQKVQQIMGIAAAMSGKPMQQAAGIAGNQTLQSQMTQQELEKRVKELQEKVLLLCGHQQIGLDKLEKIIDAVVKDPSLVDKVLVFI